MSATLNLNLGSVGHSHQWRWLQYNSSICLPLVMGLNQLPQREFPSLAPAAWRPGSQVCGCSALRFTADCNGLSVIRIPFKRRLKFGSSSHPFVGAIRYLQISWAMLTCGNHGNLWSLPTSVRRNRPFAPPDAVPEELVERLRKLQSRVPHNSPYPRDSLPQPDQPLLSEANVIMWQN